MNCLSCGANISESFLRQKSRTEEFKGGRFACPHCGAEHVCRQVGQLPSGEPLYDFRLWGHLSSVKRSPSPATAPGGERRRTPRAKPWR
jgi:hypothetical protein